MILFDNAGVASSSGETPNTIDAVAEHAADFVNALGLSQVDVIGFSIGGYVAQALTLRPREVVSGPQHLGRDDDPRTILVLADELKEHVIDLEGRDLVVVDVGHTDTDHTTCLHVPSVGVVVAGDAVYNDVPLYLLESNVHRRTHWIAALDTLETLTPRAVVGGHNKS